MNDLLRGLAPISDKGWEEIEEEAKMALRNTYGARRIVDFSGPHGWDHSTLNIGHVETLNARLIAYIGSISEVR